MIVLPLPTRVESLKSKEKARKNNEQSVAKYCTRLQSRNLSIDRVRALRAAAVEPPLWVANQPRVLAAKA